MELKLAETRINQNTFIGDDNTHNIHEKINENETVNNYGNEGTLKKSHNFCCIICNYNTIRQNDYTKHLNTKKHLQNTQEINDIVKKSNQNGTTCKCGKQYKNNSGLWKHKKKCDYKEVIIDKETIDDNEELVFDKKLVMKILNQNNEFKELLVEQNKQIIELSKEKKNIITTNNNNKTFNLQFFLNEQCKEALNIGDFISSIQMNLEDLEETGRIGYAEGITKIIMNNLKLLETRKRPIHCSDLKRETIYIKDNDIWEKDNKEVHKLESAIKDIAHKNINQISVWTSENPDSLSSSSRKNNQYLKILGNAMSGSNHSETNKNIDKIKSNIAKEVTIPKNA